MRMAWRCCFGLDTLFSDPDRLVAVSVAEVVVVVVDVIVVFVDEVEDVKSEVKFAASSLLATLFRLVLVNRDFRPAFLVNWLPLELKRNELKMRNNEINIDYLVFLVNRRQYVHDQYHFVHVIFRYFITIN